MISLETFQEMTERIDDLDFIVKVVQANVLLCTNFAFKSLDELVCDYAYHGLTEEHFDFALEISMYEVDKSLKDWTDCKPKFPSRKKGE